MVGRRDIGSWLNGPSAASGTGSAYPGERLGLPAAGPGSAARPGRRVLGLVIDWVAALLIARQFLPDLGSFGPLLVLLTEQVLLVGALGYGLGHRITGLRVADLAGGRPGPVRALIRSVLLVLAVPALVWDVDQRGLHDKAAGMVLLRA